MISYNTSVHERTKFSPNELIFERLAKPENRPVK